MLQFFSSYNILRIIIFNSKTYKVSAEIYKKVYIKNINKKHILRDFF